jgi:cytochrome c5
LLVLMTVLALAVMAEPSGDDYRSEQSAPKSEAERERLVREIEATRHREALEQAARDAAARAEAARQAGLRAQRPLGARLTEARCTSCHTLEVVEKVTQGPIGWRWTVERMRWWHGAALAANEAGAISEHLSRSQAAGPWRRALEVGVAAVALMALPAVLFVPLVRRARRRSRRRSP